MHHRKKRQIIRKTREIIQQTDLTTRTKTEISILKSQKSNENRPKKLTQAGVSLQFFIKKPLALSQNFREQRKKQSRNRDTLPHNSINSYAIPEAVRQKNQTSPFFAPTFHHLLTINSTSISKTPKQA